MDDAIPLLAIAAFAADHMRPAIAELAFFVRLFQAIAMRFINRYPAQAAVNPVAGCASPEMKLTQQRSMTIAGAFFVPAVSRYGGCAWEGFGPAGFQFPRSCTPAHSRRPSCASDGGGSKAEIGVIPMPKKRHILTLNPLKARAAAHRAMALAALRADSSLSVRLKRFNAQMAMACALEAQAMEFRRKTDATDTAIELRRSSPKHEG